MLPYPAPDFGAATPRVAPNSATRRGCPELGGPQGLPYTWVLQKKTTWCLKLVFWIGSRDRGLSWPALP